MVTCARGHVFKATPHRLKAGSWCRRCRQTPWTYKFFKRVVQDRGGVVSENNGMRGTYNLTCDRGHSFKISPHRVIMGHWCHTCTDTFNIYAPTLKYIAHTDIDVRSKPKYVSLQETNVDLPPPIATMDTDLDAASTTASAQTATSDVATIAVVDGGSADNDDIASVFNPLHLEDASVPHIGTMPTYFAFNYVP